jgi:hypothetical protein
MRNIPLTLRDAFFISLFLLFSWSIHSQGNLQFNQVISSTGSTSNSTPGFSTYNSIAYTVPNGKVWKLEYVFGATNGWYITVNNNVIYYTNTTGQSLERTSPIWLKAGDVLRFSALYSANSFYFSGIEFNVIP